MAMKSKRRGAQGQRQQHGAPMMASNERGDGDFAPPRSLTRRMVARPVQIQAGSATQPKITKRLIRVNFTPGRRQPIEMITDHVTEGSAASVVEWFNDARAQASAHVMIRKKASDGGRFADIDQFVEFTDKAWHNGRVSNPRAPLVLDRPDVNPNEYAIGIEHEGKGTEELTPEQRASSLWLHAELARQFPRIRLDRRHVVGHREVFDKKTCPGGIDVDRLVRELSGFVPMPIDEETRPRIVYSDFFKDYLIVTRVVADTEWYFVRAKSCSGMAQTRAQTPLSEMPLRRDE